MIRLSAILAAQTPWSNATFGPPSDRRARGALNHLKREADEASANLQDVEEFADVLLLLLDANRCAGHSLEDLITAAESKLVKNIGRKWGERQPDGTVEHVRDGGGCDHFRRGTPSGTCDGDGHYECRECSEWSGR